MNKFIIITVFLISLSSCDNKRKDIEITIERQMGEQKDTISINVCTDPTNVRVIQEGSRFTLEHWDGEDYREILYYYEPIRILEIN